MELIDKSSIRKPLPRKTSSSSRRYSLEHDSSGKYNNNNYHHYNVSNKTPSPFIKLAASKQFDKIESILRTKETDLEQFLQYNYYNNGGPTDLQTLHQSMTTEDTARNSSSQIMMMQSSSNPAAPTTPLHQLLQHRPPYSVVSLLCRILNNQNQNQNDELRSNSANGGLAEFSVAGTNTNPSRPEDSTDENGRKPLHIACEYGCDYTVIKRLLKGTSYARPFMTCDSYGKLPLHYACANPRGTSKVSSFFVFSSSNKKGVENMIQIIDSLLHAYPRGVIVKDEFNKTPIDIATENRADPRILHRLQQALDKVKANTNAKQQQQQQQQQRDQQHHNQHNHQQESRRGRQERRRSLTTTTTHHAAIGVGAGGGATVTPSVATGSIQSIYTTDQQSKYNNNQHSYTTNEHYYRNHRRTTTGRTKQRIVLNDEPIDLDKEMEKVYNNNELEYYTSHQHHHQQDNNHYSDMPSLINFIIECDLNNTTKMNNNNDDNDYDDDVSSLGVDGISKHERKFQPFTNITDLVDI